MGSPSEIIDISTSARRIGVDNRISLRFYFRIADNILKQVPSSYSTLILIYGYSIEVSLLSSFIFFDMILVIDARQLVVYLFDEIIVYIPLARLRN